MSYQQSTQFLANPSSRLQRGSYGDQSFARSSSTDERYLTDYLGSLTPQEEQALRVRAGSVAMIQPGLDSIRDNVFQSMSEAFVQDLKAERPEMYQDAITEITQVNSSHFPAEQYTPWSNKDKDVLLQKHVYEGLANHLRMQILTDICQVLYDRISTAPALQGPQILETFSHSTNVIQAKQDFIPIITLNDPQ